MRLPPFDRSKPFRPLVINFLMYLEAWRSHMDRGLQVRMRERIARSFVQLLEEGHSSFSIEVGAGLPLDPMSMYGEFADGSRHIFLVRGHDPASHQLAYLAQPEPVHFRRTIRTTDADGIDYTTIDLVEEYREDGGSLENLSREQVAAAGVLLIAAYAKVEQSAAAGGWKHSPVMEFLRHARNGAAHGGRFEFRNGEPRRPASWRSLSLSQCDHGKELFSIVPGTPPGYLKIGDPILLLWDIEQAFL